MAFFGIDIYTFEYLALAKTMYDHGLLNMDTCGNMEVCEDIYELVWEGIANVFQDFKIYYNQDKEWETLVFRDPVITEFYRLCSMYEKQQNISEEDNSFRQEGERAVYGCFTIQSYDYDVFLYDGSHGSPRMVVLCGEEFCGTEELPEVLADVKNTYQTNCNRLKMALAGEDAGAPTQEIMEKEAA